MGKFLGIWNLCVPWPPLLEAAEEKRRLGLLLKWHFFQRRNGVTLRSTSIETEDLNGEEVVDIIHGTGFVMGTARNTKNKSSSEKRKNRTII